MFNNLDRILENATSDEKYVYYGLTESESKKKILKYPHDPKYDGKALHTSLETLIDFLIESNMKDDIPYYTIVPLNQFEINDDIIPEKGIVFVKTPYQFKITNIHTINYHQ